MILLFLFRVLLSPAGDRAGLEQRAVASAAVSLFLTIIWAVTSRGYFWPVWPMLVLGLRLAVEAAVLVAPERLPGIRPELARQSGISLAAARSSCSSGR